MPFESPYEPPKSELVDFKSADMSRKGRYVVLKPNVEWPSRCFKCNGETEYKKEMKLTYVNPWIYLSILINVLITIILALIFRKNFPVKLPLCKKHTKKRKNFLIFQWVLLALFIATVIIGVGTESLVIGSVAAVFFVVLVISSIFGRLAYAARYKNGSIWVTGAGKDFLNSLPDYGG